MDGVEALKCNRYAGESWMIRPPLNNTILLLLLVLLLECSDYRGDMMASGRVINASKMSVDVEHIRGFAFHVLACTGCQSGSGSISNSPNFVIW